jgi:ubiquinone/menaquinone biosynthesis C-methylase UbiE
MNSSAAFTGSVPAAYDRYLAYMFDPHAAELVSRIPDGSERVLELACGTGIVTKRLREVLPPAATLVATDLNQAMLDHARDAVPVPGT